MALRAVFQLVSDSSAASAFMGCGYWPGIWTSHVGDRDRRALVCLDDPLVLGLELTHDGLAADAARPVGIDGPLGVVVALQDHDGGPRDDGSARPWGHVEVAHAEAGPDRAGAQHGPGGEEVDEALGVVGPPCAVARYREAGQDADP